MVGIFGNFFTILILSYAEMRNSFNDLLTFLSLFDIMFITITIIDYSLIRGKARGEGEVKMSSFINSPNFTELFLI